MASKSQNPHYRNPKTAAKNGQAPIPRTYKAKPIKTRVPRMPK